MALPRGRTARGLREAKEAALVKGSIPTELTGDKTALDDFELTCGSLFFGSPGTLGSCSVAVYSSVLVLYVTSASSLACRNELCA